MAVKTMKDYFTATKVADYTAETLSVHPWSVLPEFGDKKQVVHEFDDGSVVVARMSDDTYFDVELQFDNLSESDAGVILDLWHNTSKANGRAKTFYWDHPNETNIYVARFMDVVKKTAYSNRGGFVSVDSVKLRIEGYKA